MARAAKARGYAYLAVTDHSHYLRDGRLEAQAEEIAALNAKLKPFRCCTASRRTSGPTGRSTSRTRCSPQLDWVVASIHAAFDRADRARARRDGEPARRLHRPPHRPEHQQAAALRRTSTSSGCSRRRSRPGRRSRSTRSPTGSTCATPMRGSRASAACAIPVSTDAHRSRRSTTPSSASARPAEPG